MGARECSALLYSALDWIGLDVPCLALRSRSRSDMMMNGLMDHPQENREIVWEQVRRSPRIPHRDIDTKVI